MKEQKKKEKNKPKKQQQQQRSKNFGMKKNFRFIFCATEKLNYAIYVH